MLNLDYLQQIKNSIISQYQDIMKLPENEKNSILQTLYTIQEVEHSNYRMNELAKAGLNNEVNQEQQKINSLISKIKNPNVVGKNANNHSVKHQQYKSQIRNQPVNIDIKVQEVMNFMKKYMQKVGHKQAIKDFQYGLNILNKKRKNSKIEAFQQLKQDGDFGVKTHACISNLCMYYSPRIICNNIQKGAITNAIFDTKNDKRINTEKKIEQIHNNLKIGGRK